MVTSGQPEDDRLFTCRKCRKSGDIRWLIAHGHSRLGSWLLRNIMGALDGWTGLKRQGRQGMPRGG